MARGSVDRVGALGIKDLRPDRTASGAARGSWQEVEWKGSWGKVMHGKERY